MNKEYIKSLFNEYRDKVFGFFVKNLGDRELAKDLTQEVFYKLCKKGDQIVEIQEINSYIFLMTRNIIFDHLRKAANERDYRDHLIREWKETPLGTNFQKPEAEKQIETEYFDEIFNQTVDILPPQQKLIVTLSKKEGLSNKSIAKKLGISPNTVKNHLHQALKSLRSSVNPNMELIIIGLLGYWMVGLLGG